MLELTPTTEYVYVRHYRIVTTPALVLKHQRGLHVQNELHNYAVKYLEKTYGRKHVLRPFPRTLTAKQFLVAEIAQRFAKDCYALDRWNANKIGLHSQGARLFLLTLLTNFSQYRKTLFKAFKMSSQEKSDYKNNEHGNNAKHRSWYRKGSLNFLRKNNSYKTISLPDNKQIKVVSNHGIKIQDFGVLQVVENIKNLANKQIVISKLKLKGNGHYELQLVIREQITRKQPNSKIGVDWNMKDNKIFHTSTDQTHYLATTIADQADYLEAQINTLKSRRDKLIWLGVTSQRLIKLNQQIKYLNIKRTNILDEAYKKLARALFQATDLVVVEQLDSKEMRAVKRTNTGLNRKLAKIKPYRLMELIEMRANKSGKTLIRVDSYKTSQVEYGTEFAEKHPVAVREWISKYTGNMISRDLNASKNILAWGLDPEKHIKLKDYPAIKPSSLIAIN
ncbi:transposase [Periweissella ghanensis]|uniref:Cas12f1-like TNB domain-containing protein n=1 Tax=Periweissella ghanensis TaxID=467997 RepID=A0ABM8Z910_9LACO|nr:transposase [Periweissella ghanensis]CAH0417950.1 hypothetical protein WGH24286_00366 [Periweissella ghanensis]